MNPFFIHSFKEFALEELDLLSLGDIDEVEFARLPDERAKFEFLVEQVVQETRRNRENVLETYGETMSEEFMKSYGIDVSKPLIDILEKADISIASHKGGKFRFEDISLRTIRINHHRVELIYESPNKLADFVMGLINGMAKIKEEKSFKLEKMELSDESTLLIFEKY